MVNRKQNLFLHICTSRFFIAANITFTRINWNHTSYVYNTQISVLNCISAWLIWMYFSFFTSQPFFHIPQTSMPIYRVTRNTKTVICSLHFFFVEVQPYRESRHTDRQIFYWQKKSHYRLICHRNERDICTCIYKIVNLLKSYDNIHGMTYTTKIMLSDIAKIKTGYFDNINDYYLK